MWKRMRALFGRERGAAIVEFALVVPLFVTLVLGVIMFSRAYTRLNALHTALREGGRMAAADQYADSLTHQRTIKAHMRNFSSAFGFPIDTSLVAITYSAGAPSVTVGVTNYPIFAGLTGLWGMQGITVTRSVVFRHEWS